MNTNPTTTSNLVCNKCGKTLPPLEKGESECKTGYLCRDCFTQQPIVQPESLDELVEKCLKQLYGEPYIYNTHYRKCYLSPRKIIREALVAASRQHLGLK